MKRSIFTLMSIFTLLVMFNACKKDDDKNTNGIEGTWKSTKSVYYSKLNGVKEGKDEVDLHDNENYNILTLKEGKYTVKEYYEGKMEDEDNGTYTYSNGKLIVDGEATLTVTISGNTLVLVSENPDSENEKRVYGSEEHYIRN
ncbi:hypothetical protein Pedsa_0248 [Pseudopedobacter saltans DSM 12145]|uniref:Lipocalin-like domain-containing protein n=1 Tax=Pseudopedobacter saltans (strain ATCC 51119 / DSM 12145 / JCM 21818 / CCUG 39354 / LMG 10337 / NBRC 100064 / NCIMB 13643) TaxID=762903 RepID=F0SEG9_PSESL|nr:lipocalin family protein [Pseudopedobacter saltans]ADY50834.1 hypothetical protein Pedsa_0248 [Pseudopedobacter saltans DSM 12145]